MPQRPTPLDADAVIVGGGPAGATAALVLARAGFDVLVLERTRFPRFHVGESLLPRNTPLFAELGLTERLAAVPHTVKRGVEFAFGHDPESRHFAFTEMLLGGSAETINVERAPFDAMLLAAAAEAGARVEHGVAARRIERLGADGVEPAVSAGRSGEGAGERRLRARWLLDASGQATFAGKQLRPPPPAPGARQGRLLRPLRGRPPAARRARRRPDDRDDGRRLALAHPARRHPHQRRHGARPRRGAGGGPRRGVPPEAMLAWGIARCPFVTDRTAGASGPPGNGVTADFSYRCAPFAGPGWFLVGDAATFVDPIFSTGVCLGMMAAVEAARGVRALAAGAEPARVAATYSRFVDRGSAPFFRLVRGYYDHAFRELLMEGQGPLGVHRAVLSVLSGFVFPRSPRAVRWRLALFELLWRAQRHWHLAPRRPAHALRDMPAAGGAAMALDDPEATATAARVGAAEDRR